jgi:hypothetical protein
LDTEEGDNKTSIDVLPGKKPEAPAPVLKQEPKAAPVVESPKAASVAQSPKASISGDGTALYQIEVQTGKETGAGLDAPVDIVITGSNGELPKFALKNATSKNKDLFEKGNLDVFELKEKDIGKVNYFLLSYNNKIKKKKSIFYLYSKDYKN